MRVVRRTCAPSPASPRRKGVPLRAPRRRSLTTSCAGRPDARAADVRLAAGLPAWVTRTRMDAGRWNAASASPDPDGFVAAFASHRSTRETTPCSLIWSSETMSTPGSAARTSNQRTQTQACRYVPSSLEMDEFFDAAERQQHQAFREKKMSRQSIHSCCMSRSYTEYLKEEQSDVKSCSGHSCIWPDNQFCSDLTVGRGGWPAYWRPPTGGEELLKGAA